jgi:hypothetical protein
MEQLEELIAEHGVAGATAALWRDGELDGGSCGSCAT